MTDGDDHDTSDEEPVSAPPVTRRWAHLVYLKHVATLIVAVAALITATAAVVKPETSARKSYDELSKGIEQISRDNQRNHEELEQVRTYLWVNHIDTLRDAGVTPQEARDAGIVLLGDPQVTIYPSQQFQGTQLLGTQTGRNPNGTNAAPPRHLPRPPPASTSSTSQAYVPPAYVDVTGTQDQSLLP